MDDKKNHIRGSVSSQMKTPVLLVILTVLVSIFVLVFGPSSVASRFAFGALTLALMYPVLREWVSLLRPFKLWLLRSTVRFMRKLRALQRIPVDIMVCYGAVFMLWMLMFALYAAIGLDIMRPNAVMGLSLILLVYATLRHIFFTVRSVWHWSRPMWVFIYLGCGSVALWTGKAQASRFTLELTGESAERFPNFLGLLSSTFLVLHLIQFAAALLMVVATVQLTLLFLGEIPSLIKLKKIPAGCRARFWQRLRTGEKYIRARNNGELHAISAFVARFGYIICAVFLLLESEKLIEAPSTVAALSQVLVAMEYSSAPACLAQQDKALYVRITDDRMSRADKREGGYVFDSVVCAKSG